MTTDDAWAEGSVRRLGGVTVARLAAQALGLLWFVVAARSLGATEFGVCAAGLALVFVIGAFSDLGLIRTVALRVGAEPLAARLIFVRAAQLRVLAGVAVTGVAVAISSGLLTSLSPTIVLLAGGIALASGITEIGFSVLRSLGNVRLEAALLVAERVGFLALGGILLARGGGPVAVLAAYLTTNILSALVISVRLAGRLGRKLERDAGRVADVTWRDLADVDGRWIALGSTITVLTPRVVLLILMAAGTHGDVGRFAVAQKPVEALTAMSIVLATPVLAMLSGSAAQAVRRRALRFTQLGVTVVAGATAWLMVSGGPALTAVFGELATPEVGRSAAVLALAGGIGLCRLLADATLLTEGRSATSTAVISLVPVVTAALLIGTGADRGIGWASIAVLVGEVAAMMAMLIVSRRQSVVELVTTVRWGVGVLLAAVVPAALLARLMINASGVLQAGSTLLAAAAVTAGALALLARSIERSAQPTPVPQPPAAAARV